MFWCIFFAAPGLGTSVRWELGTTLGFKGWTPFLLDPLGTLIYMIAPTFQYCFNPIFLRGPWKYMRGAWSIFLLRTQSSPSSGGYLQYSITCKFPSSMSTQDPFKDSQAQPSLHHSIQWTLGNTKLRRTSLSKVINSSQEFFILCSFTSITWSKANSRESFYAAECFDAYSLLPPGLGTSVRWELGTTLGGKGVNPPFY